MRVDGFTATQKKKLYKLIGKFSELVPNVTVNWMKWINSTKADDGMLQIVTFHHHMNTLNLATNEMNSAIKVSFEAYLESLVGRWTQRDPTLFDVSFTHERDFTDAIGDINTGTRRRDGLVWMAKFLKGMHKILSFTHALERCGLDFPLKSFGILTKWRIPLGRVYKSFLDENMKKQPLTRDCFANLALVVHDMILIQSNEGQIALNVLDYTNEFAFLKRGIKLAESSDLSLVLGYLLDTIHLMGGNLDKAFTLLEPKAQFYMVYRQRRNGSWSNDGEETDEDDDDESDGVIVDLEATLISVINFMDRKKQTDGLRNRHVELTIPMFRSPILEKLKHHT
jgi:hypothetical protein